MKITFILLPFKLPELLIRLTDRLNEGPVSFLIHVDLKTDNVTYRAMVDGLGWLPNVRFLANRFECYWGEFGRVAATIEGLRHFLSSGGKDDRVVLLSGQDYPLHPPSHIEAFFEQQSGISFMEYARMPDYDWLPDGGMYFLECGMAASGLRAFEIMEHRNRLIAADCDSPAERHPLPLGLQPYHGSSWWALTYEHADYIIRYVDDHPEVIQYFENVVVPDEMFFQTILLNSPHRAKIGSNDLQYIDWVAPIGSLPPKLLDVDDFDRIVQSNDLFARKFDLPHSAELLDLLDARLDSACANGSARPRPSVEGTTMNSVRQGPEFRHLASELASVRAQVDQLRGEVRLIQTSIDERRDHPTTETVAEDIHQWVEHSDLVPDRAFSLASGAELYLDILKSCLTRLVFGEPPPIAPETGCPIPFDPNRRIEGSDWPSQAETMVGLRRLENVQQCVVDVLDKGVPGDLIETGVWRGGVTILMRAILHVYGDASRKVWLADSFQGLPPPDAERYPADRGLDLSPAAGYDLLAVSVEEVRSNFARYGLLDDRVRFLAGWFRDTLPTAPIEQLAILRLDGDLYESTTDALHWLYPKLSVGGYAIVDDYGALASCRQATDDYRAKHNITEPLRTIDWGGVYWRRER